MTPLLIFFAQPGLVLILVLLVPLIVWLVISALRVHRPIGLDTMLLPTLVAVISLAGSLGIVSSTEWARNTEIAWTAIESARQLHIGGSSEDSLVGWPNRSFEPSLEAKLINSDTVNLEISSGSGFILDNDSGRFLNGRALVRNKVDKIGKYSVLLDASLFKWTHVIRISDDNAVMAEFSLPARLIRRHRVYSLSTLMEPSPPDRPLDSQWFEMKEWAEDIRLLLAEDGEIRILTRDLTAQPDIKLPAHLTLLQINAWQRFQLNRTRSDSLRLDFLPPWRLASPVPPEFDKNPLVVTDNAMPGDFAFVLPLGGLAGDLRSSIKLTESEGGSPEFSGNDATKLGDSPNNDPRLPPGFRKPGEPPSEILHGATSQIQITTPTGDKFYLATVKNLPRIWVLAFLMVLALIPLFAGLWLTTGLNGPGRWCVHGLALCVWNLLIFRLMLAFRYAIDPRYLDSLSVSGLAISLTGLAVVPGFLLLMAKLRSDFNDLIGFSTTDKNRNYRRAVVFSLLLAAIFFIESNLSSSIWEYLPNRLAFSPGVFSSATALGIFVFIFLMILVLYKSGQGDAYRYVKKLFLWPVDGIDKGIWWFGKKWKQLIGGKELKNWKSLVLALWAGIFFIAFPLFMAFVSRWFTRIVYLDTFLHDLIVPLLFCWPVAVFWLSSRMQIAPGVRPPKRSFRFVFACAVLTILLPAILLPFFIFDAGSLYGMLSVFLPLIVLLTVTRIKTPAAASFFTFALTFVLAGLMYLNFNALISVMPRNIASTAVARLLVFREGMAVQRFIPIANAGRKSNASSFYANDIRNGIQHIWENNAIGAAGEVTGLGYALAPTRQSQVRHDTLTYDSVFSFFVLSEYGLLGSIGILLLFSCPLAVILLSGRERFDMGHALAFLIVSAFLLEALIHAGMNVSLLPFTGRNLPLLAVNSRTDLLRWAILLTVAAQAVLWKDNHRGDNKLKGIYLMRPRLPLQTDALPAAPGGSQANRTSGDKSSGWGLAAILSSLLPVFLIGLIMLKANNNRLNDEYRSSFNWTGLMDSVQAMIDNDMLTLDETSQQVVPKNAGIRNGDFLSQEIARFNALPAEVRMQEQGLTGLYSRLQKVTTLKEYEQLMDDLKSDDSRSITKRGRPALFRIIPGNQQAGRLPVLAVNPEFNSSFMFSIGTRREDFPMTIFRDEEGAAPDNAGRRAGTAASPPGQSNSRPLIGPAWVMGRWTSVYDTKAPLPWVSGLVLAVNSKLRSADSNLSTKTFSKLTLDRNLQQAALIFANDKGLKTHRELLKNGKSGEDKLPPRVAISVVSLPDGEVLALGGWPRMSTGDKWVQDKDELIPPARWIDGPIPPPLKTRYGGDRNFDRMLMGSATKPLWASVVYSVHPELSPGFSVRGPAGQESEVFGIPINKAWKILSGSDNWVDLREYLKTSNNRFQVRLGFLGLSLDSNGLIAVDNGVSQSRLESMNGRDPWQRYPKFPPEIGFSKDNPRRMKLLDQTPLAWKWSAMYAVEKYSNRHNSRQLRNHRYSFWSGDESDDLIKTNKDVKGYLPFARFSPETPAFDFDKVDNPRGYINLLLGGGGNMWSNVDFAAAFGTCLTGMPVIPHIMRVDKVIPHKMRQTFPDVARRLRAGLRAVAVESNGTAYSSLKMTGALNMIASLPGVDVYAKTGTLDMEENEPGSRINRLVLALVRWEDRSKTRVKKGIVISIVGEGIGSPTASMWVVEFLEKNKALISNFFRANL